ncbi:MAG TPA: hypothetical protein VNJ70_18530 [Thermoanaerobaculia bacterium]|nr:hypothetical protein [Thermoanaerobaculia bacterium]
MGPALLTGGEWAVIEIWNDGRQAVGVADTGIAAASSAAFAESAVLEALGEQNNWIALQRTNARSKGVTLEEFLAGGERRRTTAFLVAAGGETAVAADAELISRQFPIKVERGTAIYFRAYTEAKSDQVAYVEVLYTREPELTDAFVAFIEENLRVRSRRNPAAPLEFYGVVGIAGKGPEAWFSIAGASELQAFVRPKEPRPPDS